MEGKQTRRRFLGGVAAGAAVLLVGGCGGGSTKVEIFYDTKNGPEFYTDELHYVVSAHPHVLHMLSVDGEPA